MMYLKLKKLLNVVLLIMNINKNGDTNTFANIYIMNFLKEVINDYKNIFDIKESIPKLEI